MRGTPRHYNNIWRRVQVIKVHIFAALFLVHFLSLGVQIFSSGPLSSIIYVWSGAITANKWTDVFSGIGRVMFELRTHVSLCPRPRNIGSTKWTQIFAGDNSSVSMATGYGLEGRSWFPGRRKRFFSPPQRPDRLWGPPILLYNGYWGLLPRR
jgi:hypothetical protein